MQFVFFLYSLFLSDHLVFFVLPIFDAGSQTTVYTVRSSHQNKTEDDKQLWK